MPSATALASLRIVSARVRGTPIPAMSASASTSAGGNR
jgi:hypothetical protein